MKQTLLLISCLCLSISASAQHHKTIQKTIQVEQPIIAELSGQAMSFVQLVNANTSKLKAVPIDIIIGNSNNSYGVSGNRRTALAASPAINTVTFTHRALAGAGVTSGHFMHGYSSNAGATWSQNLGPNFSPTASYSGRYPAGAIYNPPGNTNPNNAYVYYTGPGLKALPTTPPSSEFSGIVFGFHTIGQTGAGAGNSNVLAQDTSNGPFVGFPNAIYAGSNGTALIPVVTFKNMNAQAAPFKGIKVFKVSGAGTGTASISSTNLPALAQTIQGSCKIAFAPNGLTGYISYQGDDSATAALPGNDRTRIYLSKTTDGGITWAAWTKIDLTPTNLPQLDSLGLFENVLPIDSTDFTSDSNHDLTVDANGNPYIFTGISTVRKSTPTNNIIISPAVRGAYVIYSTNGGTTFNAQLIQRIEAFRNTIIGNNPDNISHDNNYTASRNETGTIMTFGYLDTKDGIDSTTDNTAPDLFLASHVLNGGAPYFTNPVNATDQTAQAGILDFGQGANYLISDNGVLEFPFVYQEAGLNPTTFAKDMLLPSTFHYMKGLVVPLDNPNSVSKYTTNVDLVYLYPNPSKGFLNLKVGTGAKNVNIEVINLVGQTVYTNKVNTGNNKIDMSNLNKGVYLVALRVDGKKITQKLVIE
jgi:Secretion system C-terminal sorting domain